MYKEVALDPACMAEYHYYALIKREFGFDKGRYAAAEVKEWAKAAVKFVKDSDLQPVKKSSIKTFLNRVQRGKESSTFLLAGDRKAVAGIDWNTWWNAQQQVRGFSVSISDGGVEGAVSHDEILEGCEQWEIPASTSVERSAEDIIGVLDPLLLMSKEVILVDQYFRLSKNGSLEELVRLLNGSSVSSLTIVSSMGTPNAQQVYAREYKPLNNRGFKFVWINAPDKYFHDRYVVTDIGALRAGHGFMPEIKKGTHADKLNFNLISKEEAQGVRDSLFEVLDKGVANTVLDIQ